MTRVLLTGATGFIGRHTLDPLLASGFEVHAISSRPLTTAQTGAVAQSGAVIWHQLDLLTGDIEAVLDAVHPTHLLHLAWYAEPGRFWNSVENLRWLEASLRLFRAFARAGGERVVCAGTCAEYRWEAETHCRELITATTPETLYGTAKHALHTVVANYAQQCGVTLAWGRIFFVFGPYEHPSRLAGSVAHAIVSGRPAETSHGRQIRDFLYTPDVADAFVALLSSEVTGPVNLASGTPMPIREFVLALATALGRPELVELGARPANPAEPERLTADVTRLRDEVGWAPRVAFADAVALTGRWWQEASR